MICVPASARTNGAPRSATENHRRLRVSIVATLLFFLAAAGLRALATADTDLPPIDKLLRDAREIYRPWLQGDATVGSILFQTHNAGARLWLVGWVSLNGQVDARILALSGIALGALALAALLHALSSPLRTTAFAIVALVSAALLVSPAFLLLNPVVGTDSTAITVLLSLVHLALAGPARARPSRFVAGIACGLLNVLHSSAGVASALALALWSAVESRRDPERAQTRRCNVAVNAVLTALGLALVVLRFNASDFAWWSTATAKPLAWPFSHAGWAIVIWAPAAMSIVRWALCHTRTESTLPLLALWAGLAALVSAATGVADAPVLFATGLIINAACLWAPAPDSRHVAAGSIWLLVLANSLLLPLSHPASNGMHIASAPPDAPALQRALRQDDTTGLTNTHGWTRERSDGALKILRDPSVAQILPASIRTPLVIEWESQDIAAPVAPAAVAAIPGSEGLPLFGTAAGAGSAADYISRPLRTSFPLLQSRIVGELRPPATSLTLRDQHNRVISNWGGSFSSPNRWRRVHFSAPEEDFRIAVHNSGAGSGIAFSAPVELGRISWLAGKIPALWPWLLAGGLVALVVSVRAALRALKVSITPIMLPSVSADTRKLLPWLALATYAILLWSHIDTTAGPNDSGGYLNTARILAGGQITAAAHLPLTAVTDAAGVTPYVPVTFRPTVDGRIAPNYPIGFPLLVAALAQVMALDSAVGACLWLHLIAGIVLVQRLARVVGLTEGRAWLAAGIVGLSPVYLFHGLQPMSDVLALVWTTAAILLAWTAGTNPWQALLAGVVTAVAVIIRPTNLFCALPILICLAGRWRSLAWWIGGGLPFAIGQAWLNHTLYGGIFSNGYGDLRTMISGEFLVPTLRAYALWLPLLFTPVVCLAPVLPFLRSISWRTRLILTVWVAAFLGFYAFYWCTWDHWAGMRFVLPAAPALVIVSLLAWQQLLQRLRLWLLPSGGGRGPSAIAAVFVVLLLSSQVADSWRKNVFYWIHANREHAVVANWVRDHAPANAVILANHAMGSVQYYTKLTCLRADFGAPEMLPADLLGQLQRSGRPVFAVIHNSETPGLGGAAPSIEAGGKGGPWQKIASPWPDGSTVWRWQPDNRPALSKGPL